MSTDRAMANPALSRLTQQLVNALVPESRNDRVQQSSLTNRVSRELRADVHGGARKEWEDVRSAIQGLSRTAKVRIQEDLADALDRNLLSLERCRSKGKSIWEGDDDMKISNLPQYVHLLLNLADKPSTITHEFAHSYLHRVPPSGPTADQLLYAEIMNSEPFDPGETWDEEVISGWSDSEEEYQRGLSSEESEGSPEEDYVKTPSSAVIRAQRRKDEEIRRRQLEDERREDALEVVRGLKDGYWNKPGILQEMSDGIYGWKALITQTNSASLAKRLMGNPPDIQTTITSTQLQREILFALSGRSGIFYTFPRDDSCSIISHHPQVNHLTPSSLENVLITFRGCANQAALVRKFINDTLQSTHSVANPRTPINNTYKGPNKTQQAFAGACQVLISDFDLWLSEFEASFTLGHSSASTSSSVKAVSSASTTSSLQLELEERYTFMLDLLTSFIPHSSNATILLNLIFTTLDTLNQTRDNRQISTLHNIFLQTVKPTWQMLGVWLQHGMPIPSSLVDPEEAYSTSLDEGEERLLETEFFIKRDRDVSWADEDFYESGFVVNDDGWPLWIGEELGESILEAGKARGLLKSLSGSVGMVEDWPNIEDILVSGGPDQEIDRIDDKDISLPTHGQQADTIENISNHLKPMCQITQFQLRRVLDEECGLEEHLDAIEGLLYHRGFGVLDDWCIGLFDKVLTNRKWQDFQTLTSAFRDAIEETQAGWMNPSAIRIRTARSSGALVGPRALGSVRANYEVPFPLSQLFSPTSMELRAEVFTCLLQLRMGQHILAQTKILDRELEAHTNSQGESEIRAMWRIRQKLLWFIDTVYIWLTDRIIDVENREFRKQLSGMTSLKSMITLELEYTRRIRNYAFQHLSKSEIYEKIQNVFDMIHTFSDQYNSCIGQNPSPSSFNPKLRTKADFVTRQRPQRHDRRKKKADISTDEEDGKEVENNGFADEASIPFRKSSLGERMKKMEKDMDEQIKQVKDGVEALANDSQTDRIEDGWIMLAFALEDWR